MDHPRIHRDPAVMVGKPCIKGARITVEHILRQVGAGASFGDLVEAYPRLTLADIQAAITYAADYIGHESLIAARADCEFWSMSAAPAPLCAPSGRASEICHMSPRKLTPVSPISI